ncbi:hypothetical protein HWV62_29238 [Athelia sp. TMB]|nr:hypothetical protein HWV62_29238 [Athelia sp. TMB]
MTSATQTKYPVRQLGKNGPQVSALGFGTMGIGAWYGPTPDEAASMDVLSYAADRGVTFWDTADIYKTSEETLGNWFAKTGRRSDIFLASKFGAFDPTIGRESGVTSKPSYIVKALQRSLAALKTDYLDLYYQHRVDPTVPIEIVLEALRPAVEAGTVRWLGLSECDADTLRRAKAVKGLGEKVVALQVEFSPFSLDIEKNGLAAAADELGVAIVAYSPLGRGLVTGQHRSRASFEGDDIRQWLPRWSEENFPKNLVVVDQIHAIAKKYNASPSQVTLAWILAEHPTWIAIPGSRTIARVEENARGAEIQLASEAIQEIRQLTEAAEVQGDRYGFEFAQSSLPLAEWKGE